MAGIVTALSMFVLRVQAGELAQAKTSLLGPLLDMLVFAPLFAAAVHYRRKREWHKRLMIVATTSLLIAAVARMPFLGTPRNVWLVQLVWLTPIFLAMAHDFAKRRLVHPIYLLGIAVLLLEGPLFRGMARRSGWWDTIATWLADRVG